MATITPTNLRPAIQHKSNLYLSILQPATLLSALVNNGSIARGARTIAYDNGTGSATGYGVISTAVSNGAGDGIGTSLMLEVTTSTGVELVRIKSITGSLAAGTITVAENGIVWGDNQTIVVKHFFRIAPVPPAIRSQIFYKDFDITYSNQNSTPNPVAIIGPHLAGFLSAGSIAFSLNSSSSYAIASGATISSRVWACVHNGGGTSGVSFSSTTAANPTLTITEVDTYWLSCRVTDSNGKTQTTYRCIFVYDTNNLPYTSFELGSLSGSWDSGYWNCSLALTGTLTQTVIPDESLAVIWHQNYFNNVEGYVNLWTPFGDNIIYAGYLWSDNDQDDWQGGTAQASFELLSPIQYLDAITDYGTISLEATTSPSRWYEYASWLTVGRGIHHLLKWDTTILEVCDVLGLTSNTYGVKVLEFTEDTVLQRINGIANDRGIHAKMVCDRLGRLHLVTDSQMLNTAGRAALDTVFSITANDISGGVNVTRNQADTRAFADLDGFSYSHPTSTPIISMIPGYIESTVSYNLPEFRGTGVDSKKSQVLNSAGAQTDGNERVGRLLALSNIDPREIRFACRGNYLGAFDIVPSIGWYEWLVSDNTLKRQLPLNGLKFACRSVTHSFEGGLIQTTEVVLQPEAQGPDGIPGNYPKSYPALKTSPPTWDDSEANADANADFGLAWSFNRGEGVNGRSQFGAIGSITLGTGYTFSAEGITDIAIAGLSDSKAIIVFRDDSAADTYAIVVNIDASNNVTSAGTATLVNATSRSNYSLAALSSTSAILTYNSLTSTYHAVAMSISGDVITVGTEVQVTASGTWGKVARLTATKALAAYGSSAVVLDLSGTTITINTPATAMSSSPLSHLDIAPLDSSSAIICYIETGAGNGAMRASLLTAITTSFTLSDDIEIDGNLCVFFNNTNAPRWAMPLSSTKIIAAYQRDDGASYFPIATVVVTRSGSTLSAGTPVVVLSHASQGFYYPTLAALSSRRAIIAARNETGTSTGTALTVSVSGSTITDNGDDTVFGGYSAASPNPVICLGVMKTPV